LQAAARESKQLPGSALSDAAWQRLTALKVPAQSAPGLVPWQLFEEVAKASGYNVVTDAFANGASFVPLRPAKNGDAGVEVWPSLGVLSRRVSARGLQAPEWEWGDAGDFLRFRSSHRDIHRAAMLPQEYLDWVDALPAPYLPEPGDEQRSVRFTLSVNPVEWTRRMAPLTNVQIQYGSLIGYGDPHDPKIAIRQALLSSIAHAIPVPAPIVQFCGTLSDEQWARMRNGGLAAPDNIPLEQVEPLVAKMPGLPPPPTSGPRQRVVVRLREPADGEESEMPGWSSLLVDVWEGDSRQTGGSTFAAKQTEVHAEWPR
jgi:hypothetical protein